MFDIFFNGSFYKLYKYKFILKFNYKIGIKRKNKTKQKSWQLANSFEISEKFVFYKIITLDVFMVKIVTLVD